MRTVSLLCTPKYGLADNWFPVLAEIKRLHPEWELAVVLPFVEKVQSLSENDVTFAELLTITDHLLVAALDERLYLVGNLKIARIFTLPQSVLQQCLGWRFAKRSALRARFAPPIIAQMLRTTGVTCEVVSSELASELRRSTVLYDLQGRLKRPVPHLIRQYFHGPRFSVNHGLSLSVGALSGFETVAKNVPKPKSPNAGYEHRAFAANQQEADLWAQTYALEASQVLVTGVPRHDPTAIRYYVEASQSRAHIPWGRVIFVISRPSNSSWLTPESKAEALNEVHRFGKHHGLGVIIRCHPSEKTKGVVRSLPRSGRGHSWVLSHAHPLHIAQYAEFAVSFHSGLPVEMLTMGVPTIELQLRRFPGITAERRHGLVLAADSLEEFRRHGEAVLRDRAAITQRLIAAKKSLYSNSNGAVRTIVRDIQRSTV